MCNTPKGTHYDSTKISTSRRSVYHDFTARRRLPTRDGRRRQAVGSSIQYLLRNNKLSWASKHRRVNKQRHSKVPVFISLNRNKCAVSRHRTITLISRTLCYISDANYRIMAILKMLARNNNYTKYHVKKH